MGRVNKTRVQSSLSARHRSTRLHRATRFRAFRSVLKSIERLPAGFMRKLKWLTPRVGYRRETSITWLNNGHVIPKGHLAYHVDTPRDFTVGITAPPGLKNTQQVSKGRLFPTRKARILKCDARKHGLPRPNYMGISPAILLRMMLKIEKVKWKSPPLLGNARTSNAIMLQTVMSEDSPTMISVKNIEGIRCALNFLKNIPENVLPTFVQRNSTLKRFIQKMETHSTSAASGHTKTPRNDLGIIEQTVHQLQCHGLVKSYLDKLSAYSSGSEASSMDAETLMQQVLVDATNSVALSPQPKNSKVIRRVDKLMVDSTGQNAPKLHVDTSQKRAVISFEGSRCHPINLENVDLPQHLFQEMPNPFLDKVSSTMDHSYLSWEPPNSDFDKRAQIDMTTDPALLRLSTKKAAFDSKLHLSAKEAAVMSKLLRTLYTSPFEAAEAVCSHAPCMFNTCKNCVKMDFASLFREDAMIGGLGGQYITTSFHFGDDTEGVQFYQAAADIKRIRESDFVRQKVVQKMAEVQNYKRKIYRYCQALQLSNIAEGHPNNWDDLPYPAISSEEISSLELELTETDKALADDILMDAIARDTPERRKMLEDYDVRTLLTELQPTWHELKEKMSSKPRSEHERAKVSKETIEGDRRKYGRGSKHHQTSLEKDPQYPNLEVQTEDTLITGSPTFRLGSPHMSTSSESDLFLDCEENSSIIKSSPPKELAATYPEMDGDRVMLGNPLATGQVHTTRNSNPYLTYSSSSSENVERSQFSTRLDKFDEKLTIVFAKESAFSNGVLDTGLPSEASTQATELMADDKACPKCEKPYKYEGALKRHIQMCLGPGIPVESLPKHSCSTCGKQYRKIGNLSVHMDSCNAENNNSQARGFPKQKTEEEKVCESLVPFPRDNARTLSGKPLCEACRSEFTSKRELDKHIKAECTILRVKGSYGRRDKKQPGTPLALNFKEPISAPDFDSSDVDGVTEITSSKFGTPLSRYDQNTVREEWQPTKGTTSGIDCGVRKGSMAEELELIYGPQSTYYTPHPMSYAPPNIAENTTPWAYPGEYGARNGDDSDMNDSPTPESKTHNVGQYYKLPSNMIDSRRRSGKIGMSPGCELTVGGKTPASVSRLLVLEPSLSELQDTKPQPTSRKLFSHACGIFGVPTHSLPKAQSQQAFKGYDFDFPPLPTRTLPHKPPATYSKRLSNGLGSYRNKPESLGLEVVTIQCATPVVCDYIVNFLGESEDENVGSQVVSVSDEDGLTVKAIVRPGFDITSVRFDDLPGIFVESEKKSFIFVQTGPEMLAEKAGKNAREKRALELGTPDEKSVKRTRGWNLRKENRK